MSSANKSKTTNFKDFKPSDITVTEFQESKDTTAVQLTAFLNYGGDRGRLELQTPWIQLDYGGVPRTDDYHATEKSRCCIRVPLRESLNSDIAMFYSKFNELDKHLGSDEIKTKLFGKKASKYRFSNSVNHPQVDEDDDKSATKPPTIKCRIAAKFDKNDVSEIKTEVYQTTLTPEGKVSNREHIVVNSIDEFANIVRFRSKIRLIVQPIRLWAAKTLPPGADKMTYGVIWQVKGIEVEPSALSGATVNSNADFIDDSDEEVSIPTQNKAQTQSLLNHLTKKSTHTSDDEEEDEPVVNKTSKKVDYEDDDEDEEDEEEPIPEPEPPKKTKGKTTTTDKKKGK